LWWGWGLEYFHIHHETTRKSCGGVGVFNIFILNHETKRFTTRFSNAIGKCEFYIILLIKFTTRPQENLVVGVGGGIFYFHHKTTRKSCGGVGFGKFSFSPQDHKIHHKIFKCYRKM
jgi:hypothetical protein